MAQGERRSHAGRGRLSARSGDPRSSERARSTRRRSDRISSRRSPVSVVETGEQEIHRDDLDPADRADDTNGSAAPAVTEAYDDGDSQESRDSRGSRTRRPQRRRRNLAESLLMRLRAVDAKRAVVLALVLGVVVLALAPSLRNYYAQRSEYSQIEASNAQLREQITDYQQKVNEQGDPAHIAAEARARLQLVRPGETPLVMVYPDDAKREAEQKRAAEQAHTPWYGTKGGLWSSIATPPEGQ